MKKAILFDLDGTLLDTAPDFAYCINTLLHEMEQSPIEASKLYSSISGGTHSMIKSTFGHLNNSLLLSQIKNEFLNRYLVYLGQFTQPFPGIIQLIDELNKHDITWGIVTNKQTRFALPLIEKFKCLSSSKIIVCGDTLEKAKPHPDPLLYACDRLNLEPQQTYYLGDALNDAKASTQAGQLYLLAHYGYVDSNSDFSKWPSHTMIYHPDEVLKTIL